ncbi:MAG TPA: hypothetical protein VF530_21020 [Planctomycetota bacterium]
MVLAPRRTPRSGLSTQGTLLLVLGGGLALALIVLLPRLATSRAAEPRGEPRRATAEPREKAQTDAARPEAPPAALQELPEGMVPTQEGASEAPPATAALQAASADQTDEPPSAPRLKYERGGAKDGMIAPGSLRAEQRERREQRLAREAEEAAALGLPAPPQPKYAPQAVSRERAGQLEMGGKRGGQQQSKSKGKERPRKPKDS